MAQLQVMCGKGAGLVVMLGSPVLRANRSVRRSEVYGATEL